MKSVYCVVAWRWAKGNTIDDAYVDEVVGPFEHRVAKRWAAKRKERPNCHATVTLLKPCCEECLDD
jgi:hypothetical protein